MENKLGCVQFDMEQTASAWERECKVSCYGHAGMPHIVMYVLQCGTP